MTFPIDSTHYNGLFFAISVSVSLVLLVYGMFVFSIMAKPNSSARWHSMLKKYKYASAIFVVVSCAVYFWLDGSHFVSNYLSQFLFGIIPVLLSMYIMISIFRSPEEMPIGSTRFNLSMFVFFILTFTVFASSTNDDHIFGEEHRTMEDSAFSSF